ncbi:hypothetical protein [Guptibacillus hwajinpoensis]|uniref:hypothetical protein n=1 Tax=Guptibacillus hwajinpoensis TaxID=208199 RepID=UPI001CFCAB83|nr:hypothetical protein [Pseudalkalibacillus hwajinpoensis]WLR58856.1 hypothetical protein LC071_17065 [Pseudalkalibacillus hwajinpoensis]
MRKITKVQTSTILLIMGWCIWEIYVWQWAKTQVGAVIRVDLLLIIPIVLIMTIISVIQIFKNSKLN